MAVDNVATRAALATTTSPTGKVAFLMESGREGIFEFQAGNFTTRVAADSLQGLYVASSVVAVSSGAWVRVWDQVNGCPEWFGAQPGNPAFDCVPALRACVALVPTTILAAKVYYIAQKWVIDTPYKKVRGTSASGAGPSTGTIIRATFANDDAVIVGKATHPGSVAAFADEIDIADFDIDSTASRTPPASGLVEDAHAAVRIQYNKRCFVTNISNREFSVGFVIRGAIYLKIRDCLSYISKPATTSVNDVWLGYYIRSDTVSGMAGGNASLYMSGCSAIREDQPGPNFQDSLGIFVGGVNTNSYYGRFLDVYIENFEAAYLHKGIVVIGDPTAAGLGGNVDFYVRHPILDACITLGMEIQQLGGSGSVQIDQPYISMLSPPGLAGIFIHDCNGVANVNGGQISANAQTGDVIGLWVINSSKMRTSGLSITESTRPVVLSNVKGSDIDINIENSTRSKPAGPAVEATTTERTTIRPTLGGASGAFRYGVSLDTASAGCTLDVTGIGNGLTTDRIGRNSVAITTQGNVSGHTIVNPGTSVSI